MPDERWRIKIVDESTFKPIKNFRNQTTSQLNKLRKEWQSGKWPNCGFWYEDETKLKRIK